jgi:hypothetical protein
MKDHSIFNCTSTVGACFFGAAAMSCLFGAGLLVSCILAIIGVGVWCLGKFSEI